MITVQGLISAPYRILEGSRFMDSAPYQILKGSGFMECTLPDIWRVADFRDRSAMTCF